MAEPRNEDETTRLYFAELFNVGFAGWSRSPTLRHVWRKVYGADYPEEVDPFSFVTLTDLRRISHELRVGPGQIFADLACGRGGPGLWIARESGATLVGIDFSRVAWSTLSCVQGSLASLDERGSR